MCVKTKLGGIFLLFWKVSWEGVRHVHFFSAFLLCWFEMPDFGQSDPWVFLENFQDTHSSSAK